MSAKGEHFSFPHFNTVVFKKRVVIFTFQLPRLAFAYPNAPSNQHETEVRGQGEGQAQGLEHRSQTGNINTSPFQFLENTYTTHGPGVFFSSSLMKGKLKS